jgi:hypothetical protein
MGIKIWGYKVKCYKLYGELNMGIQSELLYFKVRFLRIHERSKLSQSHLCEMHLITDLL